jgi:hypothetical protein
MLSMNLGKGLIRKVLSLLSGKTVAVGGENVLGEGKILKSCFGKYLSAQPNDKIEWNRDKVGQWETFTIAVATNGYSIKSVHGKYLSAQPLGTAELNRTSIGDWENVTIEPIPGQPGKYGIKSTFGKYLSVQPNGTVLWNRDKVGEWETIEIPLNDAPSQPISPPSLYPIPGISGSKKTIKSVHGKYLSAQPNGTAEWNRDKAAAWEMISIKKVQRG